MLGLPEIPEAEEVAAALHDTKWRTRYKIQEVLATRRQNQGKPEIAAVQSGLRAMFSATTLGLLLSLKQLEKAGVAESSTIKKLTYDEIDQSDDPKIKTPPKSTEKAYRLVPNPLIQRHNSAKFTEKEIPELDLTQ